MASASRTYGADRVPTGLGNIETGWQRVRITAWRPGMRSRSTRSRPTDPPPRVAGLDPAGGTGSFIRLDVPPTKSPLPPHPRAHSLNSPTVPRLDRLLPVEEPDGLCPVVQGRDLRIGFRGRRDCGCGRPSSLVVQRGENRGDRQHDEECGESKAGVEVEAHGFRFLLGLWARLTSSALCGYQAKAMPRPDSPAERLRACSHETRNLLELWVKAYDCRRSHAAARDR